MLKRLDTFDATIPAALFVMVSQFPDLLKEYQSDGRGINQYSGGRCHFTLFYGVQKRMGKVGCTPDFPKHLQKPIGC